MLTSAWYHPGKEKNHQWGYNEYSSGWWLSLPSDKYARQLGWLFPIWWDSHKIPWFQTTNQKWLCPHFWAILQMAKYSFSSGKRRETFKDKPLDGMGYLLFNQSHTVNGCKILHHQKNGWNYAMWGPPVISWFISPSNYSYLRTINHSYWSYKPTELSWGPHIVYIYMAYISWLVVQ